MDLINLWNNTIKNRGFLDENPYFCCYINDMNSINNSNLQYNLL